MYDYIHRGSSGHQKSKLAEANTKEEGLLLDVDNNSQFISNQKVSSSSKSYNVGEVQSDSNFFPTNEYERQPEVDPNKLPDSEFQHSQIDQEEFDLYEEALFDNNDRNNVIFNSNSQSYIVESTEENKPLHYSRNDDLDEVEDKRYFDKKPEVLFKKIVNKLMDDRNILLMKNYYLQIQLENALSPGSKTEETEQQFEITNTIFNKDSLTGLNSNIASQKALKNASTEDKGKLEELVHEYNYLMKLFEKTKSQFSYSYTNTNS